MTPAQLYDVIGGVTLTSESITINGSEGWLQISMKVVSGTVTVTGTTTETIGGKTCGGVAFGPNEQFTYGSGETSVNGLTIDATAGVCKVWGVKNANPL